MLLNNSPPHSLTEYARDAETGLSTTRIVEDIIKASMIAEMKLRSILAGSEFIIGIAVRVASFAKFSLSYFYFHTSG